MSNGLLRYSLLFGLVLSSHQSCRNLFNSTRPIAASLDNARYKTSLFFCWQNVPDERLKRTYETISLLLLAAIDNCHPTKESRVFSDKSTSLCVYRQKTIYNSGSHKKNASIAAIQCGLFKIPEADFEKTEKTKQIRCRLLRTYSTARLAVVMATSAKHNAPALLLKMKQKTNWRLQVSNRHKD